VAARRAEPPNFLARGMLTDAAGPRANRDSCEWRELDEIDDGERAVRGIADVGEEMQVRPKKRRAKFERHFASGESGENHEDKNEAPVEAKFHRARYRAMTLNSGCDVVRRRFAGILP